MCECGVLAHVDESGEVVALEGDPDHPLSEGYMCPKGLSYLQLVYHPDRLKYPLKRIGERGEGKWKRVSWEEALSDIASRLLEIREKYGPESIMISYGTYPKRVAIGLSIFGVLGISESAYSQLPLLLHPSFNSRSTNMW
jgi:anaerobic selenocysteine-containing dehydrogenase